MNESRQSALQGRRRSLVLRGCWALAPSLREAVVGGRSGCATPATKCWALQAKNTIPCVINPLGGFVIASFRKMWNRNNHGLKNYVSRSENGRRNVRSKTAVISRVRSEEVAKTVPVVWTVVHNICLQQDAELWRSKLMYDVVTQWSDEPCDGRIGIFE